MASQDDQCGDEQGDLKEDMSMQRACDQLSLRFLHFAHENLKTKL